VGAVRRVDRCDVHEADAVGEPQRRVPDAAGPALVELLVDALDEPLVLRDAVGLHLVADDDLAHGVPPCGAANGNNEVTGTRGRPCGGAPARITSASCQTSARRTVDTVSRLSHA